MLTQASQSLIMAIVDVAKALIKGRLTLSPKQLSNAKRHRRALHGIARSGVSLDRKRRTLVQDGNLIKLLLKPLISNIAGNLIGGIIGR